MRCPATVLYPRTYLEGDQPVVVVPSLPIGRHKAPNGILCLDHPVKGGLAPMIGAEAVQRAEELWRLSVEDPDALRAAEADAPDPQVGNYDYEVGSGVLLIDVDVRGHREGYLRLGLSSFKPMRGGMAGYGAADELPLAPENLPFVGRLTSLALWRRVDAPPPQPHAGVVAAWASANHPDLVDRARALAEAQRNGQPTIVGFAFPDEGPNRGEYHDAWIGLAVEPSGLVRLIRFYRVARAEQWSRQPQLEGLGRRSVAVIGVGALGSQVAGLLARAGLGRAFLVDYDVITAANRVRHELDLDAVGLTKVEALACRLIRINPYMSLGSQVVRFGWLGPQDEVTEAVQDCDLIINATAHIATGYHISKIADASRTPVLHLAVSSGAWGARILLQRHQESGCLECLARHQGDGADIPELAEDPEHPEVLDQGCAQPSFTGPGFELTETAAAGARLAVQALVGDDGYPAADYDLATLILRRRPAAHYTRLAPHPRCQSCTSPGR
jgi:molybdopterin/thiamine biosynthesis adenylyltransferase